MESGLTRIPLKAQLYARETYFREGWASLVEHLDVDPVDVLRTTALLMVKPDGIAAGKVETVVRYLVEHDFEIVAIETPAIGGAVWRELWRYQLTCATLDRLAVNELVLRGHGLLLVLRREQVEDVPASVQLGILKGPADVAQQTAGCLRRALGQPNRVMSFIHVPDEPADVARELAILLDRDGRRRVCRALRARRLSADDERRLAELSSSSWAARRSFDPGPALERVESTLRASGDLPAPQKSVIVDGIATIKRGERVAWRALAAALEATNVAFDPWDLATLGASVIVCDEPGTTKQIVGVDPDLWRG